MNARPCPFCYRDPTRVLAEDELTVTYKDGFPVSPGHTVIIPKRHIATLFEATDEEQQALLRALNRAKAMLDDAHHPDGYNIGINHGPAGGQTVPHLHIHLIPRYIGDCEDPKSRAERPCKGSTARSSTRLHRKIARMISSGPCAANAGWVPWRW